MMNLLPGCWIETAYGPAVCIEIDGNYISFRYQAVRHFDQKTIWILNGDYCHLVKFLKSANKQSLEILKMSGPYG